MINDRFLVLQGFLQKKGYPKTTKVCRVIDGAEPMEFIALFQIWTDPNAQKGLGKVYTKGQIGTKMI